MNTEEREKLEEIERQFIGELMGWPETKQAEEFPETDEPVNFDGGVRETAPLPSDPMREHDELLAEMLAPRLHRRDTFYDDGD
jgi:hypothetical protein